MIRKLLISVVILQIVFSQSAGEITNRIIGGAATTIQSLPYQTAVIFGNYLCGGTLIASNIVITAAHCTEKPPELRANAKVRAGSTLYFKEGVFVPVAKIYDHPNYDTNTFDNDISVLKLAYNLVLSDYIRPISIATYARASGIQAIVSGWGRTIADRDDSVSEELQVLTVPFIDSSTCHSTTNYGDRITSNMCCAGDPTKVGYDSCQGDSGGPLVHENELIGVVSWGDGCATLGNPGVYADVFALKDFISETVDVIMNGVRKM